MLFKTLSKFLRDKSGNFAILTALMAAPAMGIVTLAIDYAIIFNKKAELQEAADSAALATTKELGISSITQKEIDSIANSYAQSNFKINRGEKLTVEAKLDAKGNSVNVSLSYVWKPFFAHYLDKKALPLIAEATASVATEQTSICVLALNKTDIATIYMNQKSSMKADGCAVYTNSKSTRALSIDNNAKMKAGAIMSSGGFDTYSKANYSPVPITDAPQIVDPLAKRAPPTFGGCDYQNFSTSVDATLKPGVYCGGLDISKNAVATLLPGEYIIKDGPLAVRETATLKGDGVGFYFTGTIALFDFAKSTTVNLSAPKTGSLAGILFFGDRTSNTGLAFTIRSEDAEKFEGVIYLPNNTLYINEKSRVGQSSKWTAIIANKIDIGIGPELEINSDYAGSSVPVPNGIISGKKGHVHLVH